MDAGGLDAWKEILNVKTQDDGRTEVLPRMGDIRAPASIAVYRVRQCEF
jgi:hypothetical protein